MIEKIDGINGIEFDPTPEDTHNIKFDPDICITDGFLNSITQVFKDSELSEDVRLSVIIKVDRQINAAKNRMLDKILCETNAEIIKNYHMVARIYSSVQELMSVLIGANALYPE